MKEHITLPYVIHIIGTNGKGSTGRFISSFLHQQNKNVLHYSSPHIIKFNERIWINGNNSSDTQLDEAHKKLQEILSKELINQLTYFEYTTLTALYLSSNMDYLVLEAGLGGEFDATNVVTNNLSVITTIDIDHQEFLGNTIEKIATTKMRSCDNAFILSSQINNQVVEVKNKILQDKEEIFLKEYLLSDEGKLLPTYLQRNLQVALTVLEYLKVDCKSYKLPKLFGRFEYIQENIIVDVGHNPLAAKAIYTELKREDKKVTLIYNSYKDKDYMEVLTILKPIIKEIQIIDCDDIRMVNKNDLESVIDSLGLNIKKFDIMNINSQDYYLVFGSFLVVENFLKDYKDI